MPMLAEPMINIRFLTGFAFGIVTAVMLVTFLGIVFALFRPWIRLKLLGGHGSLIHIVAMRLRGTPPMLIIDAYTALLQSGEDVRLHDVESQYVVHRATIMDVRDLIEKVRECKRKSPAKVSPAEDRTTGGGGSP